MRRDILSLALLSFLATTSSGIELPARSYSASQERKSGDGPRTKASSNGGDQKEKEKDKERVQLEAKLVSLTVTVSDSLGRFVTGLQKEHFEVFDDGIKQEIAQFGDEDAPITLGFIYDVSGSMGSLTSRAFQSLRRFFETSHEDDEYFIIAFNSRPQLVQDFTSSPSEITDRVVFVKAKGSTALYDGVYIGIEKAKQGRHKKKALLIISDGEENNSRYTARELGNLLKESEVPVYSIGMSYAGAGAPVLKSLSDSSGGAAFFPAYDPQRRDIYTRIALMLRHQYVIAFYPTDTAANLDWHKVKVTISAPRGLGRLALSYKNGYRSFK